MGRLFLYQARNTKEGLACENCHGPGQAHVEAGGGKGMGGLITFAKNDPTPIEQRNQMCLSCHTKGDADVLERERSRDARRGVHELPPRDGGRHSPRASSPSRRRSRRAARATCRSGPQQMRALAHAAARGQDDLHVVPQPARHGHARAPQGELAQRHLLPCHAEKRGPVPLAARRPSSRAASTATIRTARNHEQMLQVAKPRLCQQCHIESRHPTSPYGRDTGSAEVRDGALVPELPCEHPRLQSPVGLRVHPLGGGPAMRTTKAASGARGWGW